MQRLTKEQAAIIGAYTGICCGPFSDIHEYVEQKLGRLVLTHELIYHETQKEIKERTKEDFMSLCYEGK